MNWDNILFGAVPYLFITVAIVGTIYRYRANRYSWSSQSSQFLENRVLFFGSVPWHFGIILVLLAHIFFIFFPSVLLAWNAEPFRLYALEITGLMLGLLAAIGLFMFTYRRFTDSRVKEVTSSWDVLILLVLAIQILTGLGIAIFLKWGSNWYAVSAVPWIWSVLTLDPNVAYVANLPLMAKVHIFNAMVFILLIPFSRFVHFLAFIGPLQYLSRPYQVVRWYGPRRPRTEAIRQYK